MQSLYSFSRTSSCLCAALVISLLVAGCTARTSVSSGYADREFRNPRYERVLIVGVAATANRRQAFEEAVAEDLRSDSTQAWASISLMDPEIQVDESNVQTLLDKKQADTYIITRVTAMEVEPVEIEGRSAIMEEQQQTGQDHVFRRQQGTLFRYDFNEDVESSRITSEYTTELTTDVYDAASGERIYTVVSRVTKVETLTEVIDVLSDEIARRLRRDNVIR